MSKAPLFPTVFEKVDAWLEPLGVATPVPQTAALRQQYPRRWQLNERADVLGKIAPQLLLPVDFPLHPARIEVDPKLCLVLPHIEFDGNFCHGIRSQSGDLEKPVEAVGRVLARLQYFLDHAKEPGWVEAEFHRERQDYWLRFVSAAPVPAEYKISKLFVDLPMQQLEPQIASAITFGSDQQALASVAQGGPEGIVKSRGWTVGTIVRGSAIVLRLPSHERWTPTTWPTTFAQLRAFVAQISGKRDILADWYSPTKYSRKAPFFVVIFQDVAVFGWRLIPHGFHGRSDPALLPINVTRIDRQWCLSRDHQLETLSALSHKSIVVLGCGSLGSPVIELLARAGVGQIDVVDADEMKPENVSRHVLGANSIGYLKAEELCSRINRDVPGAKLRAFPVTAQEWLAIQNFSETPDLVLDCTGEQAVRISMSLVRHKMLQSRPLVMAWMEPYCAAAHVVTVVGDDSWPTSDPAESAINIAVWPDYHEVELPGCGQGFHPYGMADVWRVAGLLAERVLSLLIEAPTESDVHSMIRTRAFFDAVAPGVLLNRQWPEVSGVESVTQRRTLREALHGD